MNKIVKNLVSSDNYNITLQGNFDIEILSSNEEEDVVEIQCSKEDLDNVDFKIIEGEITFIDKRGTDFSDLNLDFSSLKKSLRGEKGFLSNVFAFVDDMISAKSALGGVGKKVKLKLKLSTMKRPRMISIDSLNMHLSFGECELDSLFVTCGNLKFEGEGLSVALLKIKSGNLKAYLNKRLNDQIEIESLNSKVYVNALAEFQAGSDVSGNNVKIIGDYKLASKDVADLIIHSKNCKVYFNNESDANFK